MMRHEQMSECSRACVDPCEYCDCSLDDHEKPVTVHRRYKESHFIFERVPAQVCRCCGERYFSAKVAREMERLMKEEAGQALKSL